MGNKELTDPVSPDAVVQEVAVSIGRQVDEKIVIDDSLGTGADNLPPKRRASLQ